MIRLIATDLDGTLLRSDDTVSAYTLDVLDRARRLGVEVVPITARSPLGVEAIAGTGGLSGVVIVSGGSMVYDLDAREIRSAATIPPEIARKTAEAALTVIPDAGFAVLTGMGMLADPTYAAITVMYHSRTVVDTLDELWAAERIVRVFMHSRTVDTDTMYARVAELGDQWTHSGGVAMLELGAYDVTKATALRDYCAARGITSDEVAAFGDMPNDLPMLAWAGHPYAMANAHPSVLAAVPGRAPANDEDGVARVVEALLSSRTAP